ncbi:ABC transporter permease [Spirochaetia bacterium]|nr:ABC transporter permease [Spirochaetia bacterium]
MAFIRLNKTITIIDRCIGGFGLAVLLIFAGFSLFPAAIAPYHPKTMFDPWQKPSAEHPLGTNDMGYDISSELIYAAGSTLGVGIAAAIITLAAGTGMGILAGYLGGWKGELVGTTINIFLLIPMLPAAIVVAAYLGALWPNMILTIAVLGWCPTARIVRARTVQLKQTPFIESLLILAIPRRRILFGHILPNLSEIILARCILSVSNCMMMEASLSFIGLGDPSHVTWGGMVNLAYRNGGFSRGAVNWFLAPSLCIMLCVLGFYCINHFIEKRSAVVDGGNNSYMD